MWKDRETYEFHIISVFGAMPKKNKKQQQHELKIWKESKKKRSHTVTPTPRAYTTHTHFSKIQMTNDEVKNHSTNISFSIGKTWFLHFLNTFLRCYYFISVCFIATAFERNVAAAAIITAATAAWLRFHIFCLSFSHTIFAVLCSKKEDTFCCCFFLLVVFVIVCLLVWVSSFQNIIQACHLWGWLFCMCARAVAAVCLFCNLSVE